MEETQTPVVEIEDTQVRPRIRRDVKPRKTPRYNVVLWDDNDHSYEYVIRMLQTLFGYTVERGFLAAREVDSTGRVICLTTTLEHAELKRDQIHAYGADVTIARCKGSMSASLERVD